MMSDEECIKLLTKWWIDFFALDERVNDEENHEKRKKRINDFQTLCKDAVTNGQGELIGRNIMNHNGGEGYKLTVTLTQEPLTPEQQKMFFEGG